MSDAPIDEPALPRAPVLGYLTQTKTAARARSVTAVFTMLLGLAAMTVGLAILYSMASQVYEEAAVIAMLRTIPPPVPLPIITHGPLTMRGPIMMGAPLGPPGPVMPPARVTLGDVKEALARMERLRSHGGALPLFVRPTLAARITVIVWMLVPGFALAVCSLFVWRGRRWACGMARLFTWPFMAAGMLLAAQFVGWAVVFGIGRGSEAGAWLWLLPAPPCLLLVLLMNDLRAYQLWIARHPFTDKLRRDFISGKPIEILEKT